MPVAYFQNTSGTLVLCWWRARKQDGRSYCTCLKHNMEHCISTLLHTWQKYVSMLTEYSLTLNRLYCNHTHAELEIEPDYITAACLIWPGDSGHRWTPGIKLTIRFYCAPWNTYESIATVGEIRVWWRADFQSGSRVLKRVFWTFLIYIYGIQCDFMPKSCCKHSNFENR